MTEGKKKKKKDVKRTQYPFWFGGSASMFAATTTHPLDLAKVRLQMMPDKSLGFIGTIRQVFRTEGFLALYNGLSASLLRQATYSTVRFGVYEELKELARGEDDKAHLSTPLLVSLAMVSGFMGAAIGNPADILNVRMQNDMTLPKAQQRNYKHAIDGLFTMIRKEGPKSLTRGILANCTRGVLMTASQLASYDKFKAMLIATHAFSDNLTTHFTASLMAGFVATAVCSPVDVVKTRIMNSKETSRGLVTILTTAVKQEGIGFAFRGFVPSFVRLGPQTIITFLVLEQQKKLWNNFMV